LFPAKFLTVLLATTLLPLLAPLLPLLAPPFLAATLYYLLTPTALSLNLKLAALLADLLATLD